MTTNDYNPTPPPWLQQSQPKENPAPGKGRTADQAAAQHDAPVYEEVPVAPAEPPRQPDLPDQPTAAAGSESARPQANPRHQAPNGPVPSGDPIDQRRSDPGPGVTRQEIDSNGNVRRVPFQDDVVAQQYQAPPDQPPSNPIYTWEPPPSAQQPSNLAWPAGPPPQQQQSYQPQQPTASVNDLSLLKRAKRPPRSGWRLAVHKATGGAVNPGESHADIDYRELVDRINQPVRGDYRIAILSLKGGVGKTTTTIGLGSTFAELRGDRVIALDANPDLGTLAHRVPKQTRSTVRNLLEDPHIRRYSDVRAHTSQAPSRLEVLASEQDPAVSEAFSEEDYRSTLAVLQAFYNIILTDCGTGLMHSAMGGILDMASSLVLVTSPAIDGARSASATLDWLEHHGYNKLVERTVVVVNASRRGASSVDLDQLRKLFLDRTRAVQVVPFDDHLAEGAEIDLDLISKPTRKALMELAAMVADDFAFAGGKHATQ